MRAGIERLDERGVGDVVAERVKPELARLELDVRRAQQAARSIDDADGLERRRVRASRSQTPSAFSRSTELVSSAAVLVSTGPRARRGRRTDHDDIGAHMRQRQRGDEPRRAGADHGNVAQRHGLQTSCDRRSVVPDCCTPPWNKATSKLSSTQNKESLIAKLRQQVEFA